MMKKLFANDKNFFEQLKLLLNVDDEVNEQIDQTVAEILSAVRKNGDTAVLEYTNRWIIGT